MKFFLLYQGHFRIYYYFQDLTLNSRTPGLMQADALLDAIGYGTKNALKFAIVLFFLI
jgi:hypothetical protein